MISTIVTVIIPDFYEVTHNRRLVKEIHQGLRRLGQTWTFMVCSLARSGLVQQRVRSILVATGVIPGRGGGTS